MGASNTDLTLTVDLSDSCNDIHSCDEQFSSISSISTHRSPQTSNNEHRTKAISESSRDAQPLRLPTRMEPVGGELPPSSPSTSCRPTSSGTNIRGADPVSRSADSSPKAARHSKVVLTQYGFIDDGNVADLLESKGTVIGLREDQLIDIAANKPERLNARVRRHNRLKRNSKQLSGQDMQ